MPRKVRVRRPSPGAMLGGLALIVAAASGSYAVAQSSQPQIVVACQSNKMLFVADPTGQCGTGQTRVELTTTAYTGFLGATAQAADADKLDGMDSTAFLGATAQAADADKLDGMDSTAFLGANQVPGKVTRHSETVSVPAGATKEQIVDCSSDSAVAVGGGTHWGTVASYSNGEGNSGILNSSDLYGDDAWIGVGTNDEAGSLALTVWVVCVNP